MRPSFEQSPRQWQKETEAEKLPDRERAPEAFLREVAEDLSTEVRTRFQAAFRDALDRAPFLSEQMKQYLLARDLDVPTIEIISKPQDRTKRLEALDYGHWEDIMGPHDALFIIHLPSIMRSPVYTKIFHSDEPVPDNFVKGIDRLYQSVIDAIWASADEIIREHQVHIERVNPVGWHDNRPPGEGYYYIWRLVPEAQWS